jgi:hypothetical protein
MVMCCERGMQIEDLRNHPAEVIVGLQSLLASGAQASPDPKHPEFYELENDSRVYYIHISPTSGKVLLLATWPSDGVLEAAHSAA